MLLKQPLPIKSWEVDMVMELILMEVKVYTVVMVMEDMELILWVVL